MAAKRLAVPHSLRLQNELRRVRPYEAWGIAFCQVEKCCGGFILVIGLAFLSSAPLFAQGTAPNSRNSYGSEWRRHRRRYGNRHGRGSKRSANLDHGSIRRVQRPQPPARQLQSPRRSQRFQGFERSGVIPGGHGEVRVDLVMQPGEVSQTITVNEESRWSRPPTPNSAQRCKVTIIEDIPFNGRNFENFCSCAPA